MTHLHLSISSLLLAGGLLLAPVGSHAQERTVQNRPYTDLRTLHFGVLVGTHLQDLELINVGPQTVTMADGTTQTMVISADQDRWDTGFNVGVLAEARLSQTFQMRVAPAMYFGSRHLTFLNHSVTNAVGQPTEQNQQLKTAFFTTAFDLIAAAPRMNNHRLYVMGGLTPAINLSAKDSEILKLKRFECFLEAGVGCDFYLPFFKLRPELKFMYGLTNSYDPSHASRVADSDLLPYVTSVSKARNKNIVLTFYFE